MSMPGWYADPAGTPGRFRYWDGQAWSATTTSDPRDPAPSALAAGPGQPRPSRRGRLLIAGVVALVVIVAAVLAVNAVAGRQTEVVDPAPSTGRAAGADSAAPTTSPSPAGPEPTPAGPTPTPASTSVVPSPAPSATATHCPVGDPTRRQPAPDDGRVHGGDLSFAKQSNYLLDPPSSQLSWAYGVGSQSRQVQPSWSSSFAVGALSTIDGFEERKGAAELVLACTAPSPLYAGFTGRKDLFSKAIKVDGRPAWAVRSEISVDTPNTTLPGDVVEVIVVDTDSPESLSMFWACVPIGDQTALDQLDRVVKSLRVG